MEDRALFGFIRPAPPGPRRRAEMRCRVLEVMAASAAREVPLAPVVLAAAAETRGYARRALRELGELLESGVRPGAALTACELLAFPEHTAAAVTAAEGTSSMSSVLSAAARDGAESENRRAAAWSAAFYPLLVVSVVGGVAGGILGPTRERLEEVFESMEVPASPHLAFAAQTGAVAGSIALAAAIAIAVLWFARRFTTLRMFLPEELRHAWQALPFVRGAARVGGAARLFLALEPCVRAGMPLHRALHEAADAAGCRAVTRGAIVAADRAERGDPVDEVAAALVAPASVRARFALAAAKPPEKFADALRSLSEDCLRRHRDAIDVRMRWLQPIATACVGAIVFSQLLGIFAVLEMIRREASPW